jgi:hypothetical protein
VIHYHLVCLEIPEEFLKITDGVIVFSDWSPRCRQSRHVDSDQSGHVHIDASCDGR